MARWKSVFDAKTGSLKQVPVDNAAKLEVLNVAVHDGKISDEEYLKQKRELEGLIEKEKQADGASEASRQKRQSDEREAVLKVSVDRKKAARDSAAKRSAAKTARKGGK